MNAGMVHSFYIALLLCLVFPSSEDPNWGAFPSCSLARAPEPSTLHTGSVSDPCIKSIYGVMNDEMALMVDLGWGEMG